MNGGTSRRAARLEAAGRTLLGIVGGQVRCRASQWGVGAVAGSRRDSMPIIGIFAIALAFVLATCEASRAMSPTTSALVGRKIAGVVCCCKTYTGGTCCTEVEKCGGKPPGCFCSFPSAPAPAPKKLSPKRPKGSSEGKVGLRTKIDEFAPRRRLAARAEASTATVPQAMKEGRQVKAARVRHKKDGFQVAVFFPTAVSA
jgi:hypothetical protein